MSKNGRLRMRVYISGPITGNPDARKQFRKAAAEIRAEGDIPVNPFCLGDVIPNASHTEYMLICIKLLELSDAIYMLPGWEDSRGAKIEKKHAERLRMPIKYAP